MTRDGQVARRVGSRLFVLLEREKDVREAARIAALTQERDRRPDLELPCLLGDPLVRVAEDVLCLHPLNPQVAVFRGAFPSG